LQGDSAPDYPAAKAEFLDLTVPRRGIRENIRHGPQLLTTNITRVSPSLSAADTLRLLIDRTTDYAIFLLDPTGHVATWNPGAERMQGYTASEIIGQHCSVFYPTEARMRGCPAQELQVAQRDGKFEDEGWRVRKDGTLLWVNVVTTALRDANGQLIGFGKVSRDLSERHNSEHDLRESAKHFRLIIESTIDYAIFMLDVGGNVASWNAGAERIKGYTAQEAIGRHFSMFYPREAIERGWPQEELRRAAAEGRLEDEGWRLRKDGSRFWANVVITALRGADNTLRGFAKVTRDISERKAHEQHIQDLARELEKRVVELAASNRELAQKSAENESFVFGVSHDLRAPLVNLQGFSHELQLTSDQLQALLASDAVPADIRAAAMELISGELGESLGFIRNAVKHLSNIIDGLLRLSRVGRIEYARQSVDMSELVADILSAMNSSIMSSGARVQVHPLPAIRGDRNALGQVFANIVDNALKNLDERRAGVIDISADDSDPPVFSIRDNGVGIPVEYHSKIFHVFQHVHDSSRRGEGMGLAIVQRIVEHHAGRIWFESQSGVGTTFFVTLGPRLHAGNAVKRDQLQ
jgi:PAS domain S-box-containing protein